MKQRALERRLEKLNLKFTKAKTALAVAKRRATSTRLEARAARQAQRLAKKKARATRDAARAAESVLTKASRAFSKISARIEKLRKKVLKPAKATKAGRTQPRKAASKRPKPHRIPAPPFPVSGAETSAPVAATVTTRRGALQRPVSPVTPIPVPQIAAAS